MSAYNPYKPTLNITTSEAQNSLEQDQAGVSQSNLCIKSVTIYYCSGKLSTDNTALQKSANQ